MAEDERFYSPNDSKDAMRKIEDLFNSYRNEPVTMDLLKYHQGLINRLKGDLQQAAIDEGQPERAKTMASMALEMERWVRIRIANKPYPGKMKHFQFVADNSGTTFKRKVIKRHGGGSHRSSRH